MTKIAIAAVLLMLKGRFLRALTLAIAVSGCATVANDSRITTTLQARQFNSVASQYMPRPTSVRLVDYSSGARILAVTFDQYGPGTGGVTFAKGMSGTYAPLIDKFLEWEALATQRGEALTKEIGRAPTTLFSGSSGELSFAFHSGNEKSHYLSVSSCAVGMCMVQYGIALDSAGARELKSLLMRFDADELKHIPSGVYK